MNVSSPARTLSGRDMWSGSARWRTPTDYSPEDAGGMGGRNSFAYGSRDRMPLDASPEDAGGVGYVPLNPADGYLGGPFDKLYSSHTVGKPPFDYEMFLAGDPQPPTVILRPRVGAAPGFPGFFAWLGATHPDLYNYTRTALPDIVGDIEGHRSGGMELAGLGDTNWLTASPQSLFPTSLTSDDAASVSANTGPTSIGTSTIINTVTQAAAAFLPVIQQQKLLNVQLDRAQRGLPPLDTSAYESATAGLNVGINRSTQTTLLMIAGGLAAAFVLAKVIGRSR